MLEDRINVCGLLCKSIDDSANYSFNNIFDTVKISKDGEANFVIALLINKFGDKSYKLNVVLEYLSDENENERKMYMMLKEILIPPKDFNKVEMCKKVELMASEEGNVYNLTYILKLKDMKFPGKGNYCIKVFASDIKEMDEDESENNGEPLNNKEKKLLMINSFKIV